LLTPDGLTNKFKHVMTVKSVQSDFRVPYGVPKYVIWNVM
jgi:hypothetical protein